MWGRISKKTPQRGVILIDVMGVRIPKKIREELARRPQCLECGSHLVIKDGKQWGKQTYLCTMCYRRFTPNAKHVFRPKHVKEEAIRLFVTGSSINAIAKALKIDFLI